MFCIIIIQLIEIVFAIFISFFWSSYRIKTERNCFHTSLNSSLSEVLFFFKNGMLSGVIISILFSILNFLFPNVFILSYQLIFFLELFSIIGLLFSFLEYNLNLIVLISTIFTLMYQKKIPFLHNSIVYIFLILSLISLVSVILIYILPTSSYYPKIKYLKRRFVGIYQLKQFYLIPLLVYVPMNNSNKFIIHNNAIFILPLILGFSQSIKKQFPQKNKRRIIISQLFLFIIYSFSILFIIKNANIFLLLIINTILTLIVQIILKYLDKKGKFCFTKVNNGIRVLYVIPNTPADKMGLQVGDVIVKCNSIYIHNENEFYYALQKSPTFCHLKVLDPFNEYRILESAIYNDSPYEIGVITFKKVTI